MANKGNYYKLRTRDFFLKQGYQVDLIEKYNRIFKDGKIIFTKRDVFGSDGISMKEDELIFWNAVFGKANIARAVKNYKQFIFPSFVKVWVVAWEERVREPEIVELKDENL